MGIVLKQSFKNLVITYLGFLVGALNTLFLYTHILSDAYYGLVTFILASGTLLMPLMAFGAHNVLIKFYSSYTETQKDGFLTVIVLIPLVGSLFVGGMVFCFYESLADFLSPTNPVVKDYLWYVVLAGLAMAYFEVFYAWCKVHLQSVFGNFMKEIFGRIGVSVLLLLLYVEIIAPDFFFKALVGVYFLRTLLLNVYAYWLRLPRFTCKLPANLSQIAAYAFLILLGGSASLILLEIDKVMLNYFIPLEYVAYYGVAVYMATVVIVPSRAMQQIIYPLTAALLNGGKTAELKALYRKSSLTLFIASGFIFILIMINLEDLYRLLPQAYQQGYAVVFWIGLAKVSEALLGNANALLYNSNYYKTALLFGLGLAALMILLNVLFIPRWGLEGAAVASVTAIVSFNLIKLGFLRWKFGVWPFTKATFKVFVLLLAPGLVFYLLPFSFAPLLNIVLQSTCILVVYIMLLYRFKVSEDVSGALSAILSILKLLPKNIRK